MPDLILVPQVNSVLIVASVIDPPANAVTVAAPATIDPIPAVRTAPSAVPAASIPAAAVPAPSPHVVSHVGVTKAARLDADTRRVESANTDASRLRPSENEDCHAPQ